MQLLAVIHHPGRAIRSGESIAHDLAQTYDRVMGAVSQHHHHSAGHVTTVLLNWPSADPDWPAWHRTEDGGVLATVGYPLIECPAEGAASPVTADRLAQALCEAHPAKPNALACIGGYFAAIRMDPQGLTRLATNYLGEVPLHRAERHGITVWSNKAAVAAMLAGLSPQLDAQAAVEFVILSHPLENRTLWQGVSVLPAATLVSIDTNGPRQWSYMDLPRAYFARRLPPADAADKVIRDLGVLAESLRPIRQRLRVHLSGGMDSRAVAAILRRHELRPTCVTHNAPNEEVPAARLLARHLGLKHQVVPAQPFDREAFHRRAGPSLWMSDGLMSLKYLSGVYDLERVRDGGYVPIEGLGGEYGRGYYYGTAEGMDKLAHGDMSKVFGKAISGRGQRWPRADDVHELRRTLQATLDRSLAAGLDAYQASTFYYVNQKMRRWATARRNVGWTWVIDPLQMPCWTLAGMSAAPQDQYDDGLIRTLIETAWPGTTTVPTVPELAYAARRRRVASNRLVRIAMKCYDRCRPKPPTPARTAAIPALLPMIDQLIGPTAAVLDPLLGAPTVQTIRRWLDSPTWDYDQTELFWHTLTLGMWARVFLLGRRDGLPPIRPCFDLEPSDEPQPSSTRP